VAWAAANLPAQGRTDGSYLAVRRDRGAAPAPTRTHRQIDDQAPAARGCLFGRKRFPWESWRSFGGRPGPRSSGRRRGPGRVALPLLV